MNKIYFAAGAALLTLTAAFTACSSDEDINGAPHDMVVRVATNVTDMTTRGTYNTQSLDSMGFAIKNANSTTYSYSNVKFTKNSNTWTPASLMLWQDDTQAVDIVAYAPYKDVTLSGNLCDEKQMPVEVQTVQTKDDNTSDFLVFKQTGFVPKTGLSRGAVPVTFSHAMSRLTLKIKFGTEFDVAEKLTANPIEGLTISGTIVKGSCDFTAATPVVSADTKSAPQAVSPYEAVAFQPASGEASQETTNAIATYECILMPQQVEAGSFNISVTLKGKVYVWSSPSAVTFEPNNSYSLTLTLGNDAIVENGHSVKTWTSQTAMERETD